MPIEGQVNNIADLNPTYPQADDPVSQGDNHVRNIKKALKDTFPNIDGAVLPSEDELNQLVGKDLSGDISSLESRVSKNEADIANNSAGISNNAAGISNNADAIVSNTNYIKDVEVIAVNNEREIAGHETRITKNEQDISALQGQVGSNDSDLSSLSSRVSKNESDIATNKSSISKNAADISALQGQVGSNDSDISSLSGRVSKNESDISSLNGRVSKNESDISSTSQIAQTNQLNIANINSYLSSQKLDDLSDVNTGGVQEGYVLAYVGGNWVPMKLPSGGGMIKPTQQPATAGDFSYHSRESAYRSYNKNTGTVVLTVPPGKIFSLEYIAAYGMPDCTIDQNNIKIDGITISGGSYIGGSLAYDSNGGPTWPGNEGFNPIRVEQSISVPISTGSGEVYISGMFTEE
jgi:TolA-binding protein